MMRAALLSAAALLLAAPLSAQEAAPAAKEQAAPVDPVRLDAARRVVGKLVPPGTYRKMMGDTFDGMLDSIADMVGEMSMGSLAQIGGLSAEEAEALGPATLREVMEIYDPAWKQRMVITQGVMTDLISDLMDKMEPRVREAMSRAYAREFSMAQLGEIEAFFATATGAAYAEKSFLLQADKEVMSEVTGMMPEIMAMMPELVAKAKEAEAKLPPPRKMQDLTEAERRRLAELLGVPEQSLRDPKSDHTT